LEVPGGRGAATYVQKCKDCGRHGSVDAIKDTWRAYNADDAGDTVTLAVFECRNLELERMVLGQGWRAKGQDCFALLNNDGSETFTCAWPQKTEDDSVAI